MTIDYENNEHIADPWILGKDKKESPPNWKTHPSLMARFRNIHNRKMVQVHKNHSC